MMSDGRKLRQQEFQEKRELLEFTESQLNQLTYEIKEEIKQHTEEVERKVCMLSVCLHFTLHAPQRCGVCWSQSLPFEESNFYQSCIYRILEIVRLWIRIQEFFEHFQCCKMGHFSTVLLVSLKKTDLGSSQKFCHTRIFGQGSPH